MITKLLFWTFSQVLPQLLMRQCNITQKQKETASLSWCSFLKKPTKKARPTRRATKIYAKLAKNASAVQAQKSKKKTA